MKRIDNPLDRTEKKDDSEVKLELLGWEYEYTMIITSINKYERQRILKIGVDIESVLHIWVPLSHPEGNIHKGLRIDVSVK